MKRRWPWIAGGAAAAVALFANRRNRLGLPFEGAGVPTTTPHGYFDAHRDGPPPHFHQGIDLAAAPGGHVLAIGDGVIVSTDPGLGKLVRKLRLDESSRWRAGDGPFVDSVVYADLGYALVDPGDRVRRGEAVAVVGSRGFFHFAVKEDHGTGEGFFDPARAGFVYRVPGRKEVGPWLV
jgi:murein DD-endopeptidase MepM/ murein hydrolase activator NlpD